MELKTHVTVWIDLSSTIKSLSDRERIEWVRALLETISEEGTIDAIRSLADSHKWDDQQPTTRE